MRIAALEFMINLSEAKLGVVKQVEGWTAVIVGGCLDGMAGLEKRDVW